MALTPDDLKQPDGELAASYFPDGDLDDLLPGWLSRAVVKVETDGDIVDQDGATAAWVYYLAYSYLTKRFNAMPNTLAVGSGEVTRAVAQDRPAYWQTRASEQLAAYEGYITVPVATVTTPRQSLSVQVVAVW